VIRNPIAPHQEPMDAPGLVMRGVVETASAPSRREKDARITAIVRGEHDFIWRLLRRLGVPEANVDDATQQVFCVAARRVNDIRPGSERSFLFGAALRVAADRRRSREFREQPHERAADEVDPGPNPEELAEKRQRRLLLDRILGAMPMDLRTVLVLFEFEQMTKSEVGELLGIPVGTAVSRLRRAREEFKTLTKRHLAREAFTKVEP
jgi:RNA polymerase sigma-70 factor (ECF subfamily)